MARLGRSQPFRNQRRPAQQQFGPIGYTFTCDPGTYAITGSDANLTFQGVLQLEEGAYTLNGTDAVIAWTAVLPADGGTYEIDGSDADVRLTRTIQAEPGVYEIVGGDVVIVWTPFGPRRVSRAAGIAPSTILAGVFSGLGSGVLASDLRAGLSDDTVRVATSSEWDSFPLPPSLSFFNETTEGVGIPAGLVSRAAAAGRAAYQADAGLDDVV